MSQNITQIINQLFSHLEQLNAVIYRHPSTFSSDFKEISGKVKEENLTFHKIDKIFADQNKLKLFLQNMNSFGLTEPDVMRWYSHFMVEYALAYIEYCRRYFLEMLDHNRQIGGRRISFNTPIGTLLTAIENQFNFPDVQQLFPRQLRNVLGHASWWWDNGEFVFRQNGVLHRLSYGDFRNAMTEFEKNFEALFNGYMARIP